MFTPTSHQKRHFRRNVSEHLPQQHSPPALCTVFLLRLTIKSLAAQYVWRQWYCCCCCCTETFLFPCVCVFFLLISSVSCSAWNVSGGVDLKAVDVWQRASKSLHSSRLGKGFSGQVAAISAVLWSVVTASVTSASPSRRCCAACVCAEVWGFAPHRKLPPLNNHKTIHFSDFALFSH